MDTLRGAIKPNGLARWCSPAICGAPFCCGGMQKRRAKNAVFCGKMIFFGVSSCVVLYFVVPLHPSNDQMVRLVQLVRMSDCGSEGRGFESHISPPVIEKSACQRGFFCYIFTALCRPCLTGGVGHKKALLSRVGLT